MDRETLDKIEQLVIDANKVYTFRPDGEPSHVYYLKNGDMVTEMHANPAVIGHVASTLETLADKAKDTVTGGESESPVGSQIWVDRSGVVLLLDENRRDRVTFFLSLSEQVMKLGNIGNTNLSQKDLVFQLRTTFRDCLGLAGDILPIVRKVKFNANQSGDSEIKHGSSSVGKTLTAEIQGTGALPEYVTLTLPVFAQAGVQSVRANVECALEPDAATCTFRLIPLPGQIERAVGDGERQVAALLHGMLDERKAGAVSVFMGKP